VTQIKEIPYREYRVYDHASAQRPHSEYRPQDDPFMTQSGNDQGSRIEQKMWQATRAIWRRTRNYRLLSRLAQPITREVIACQYLTGSGIEVGALHSPLRLPAGVSAKYVDFEQSSELDAHYPELSNVTITRPDIISDLETLRGIDDSSQDFVIANHVLEHCEDPIKAIKSVARVLRARGIAYLAIPDRRFTFDEEREVTTLAHLIRDHEQGPDVSLREHYEDWCRHVDKLQGQELSQKVELLLATRGNVHFHVWEYPDMMEFFHYMTRETGTPLDIEMSFLTGNEVIWILRRH
jgi:SAM-dependent methyltransferase